MENIPLPEYVKNLSAAERTQLIKDYEEFYKKGSIGECALRTLAEAHMREATGSVVLMMFNIAFEAFRWGYYNSEFYTSGNDHQAPVK